MDYDENDISNKSQMVTLLLLLFLGGLGAHRFYVGKFITGVIFCVIGASSWILSIIGFKFAFSGQILYMFIAVIDLYALYSDSFTDSMGKFVIGKEKIMIYNTYEERDQKIFFAKLNKIAATLLALTGYITLIILRNLIL